MPQFRYLGEPRTYHAFGDLVEGDLVDAEPGDDVPDDELESWVPDHRFVLVDGQNITPRPKTAKPHKPRAPRKPAPEPTE